MDSRYWTVAAVLPAVFLAACSSSGGNNRSVVITDQPIFADDGITFEQADGTEFPLLQAFARLDAGNNVTAGGINNDDASFTPLGAGGRLKVASLNRDVTFNGDDAHVDGDGVVHLEQPVSDGVAHLTLFGDTANLVYSQFGVWEFNRDSGAVDAGFWVAGLQTRPEHVPDIGSATYNGRVIGGAANGTDAFDLLGDVTMTADFETGGILGGFSNMTATNVDDHSSQFDWNDVTFTANILDARNTFSGTATATGPHANETTLADGTTGALSGRFFGPTAEEAGGAWLLSDGTVSAAGSFGATQ